MQQLKALIRKEWQIHRNSFLTPFWVMLSIYGIAIISVIYGSIRFGLPNLFSSSYNGAPLNEAVWAFHYGAAVFIAWLCIITNFSLTDACLNSDHIKKCEIFHLAQPVSLAKLLASKALFSVVGILIQYLVLATVNCLVLSLLSWILGIPSLSLGLNAVINTVPYLITALVLITPLVWFSSSLFRKMGGLKALMFLIIIEVIRGLFKMSWGINLYSPVGFINRILLRPFNIASEYVIDTIQRTNVRFSFVGWSWDYTMEHLGWFVFGIVLIIASYHVYKRRNIN